MSVPAGAKRILVRARSILSDPDRWEKGDFVVPHDDRLPSYCLIGAVGAAAGRYINAYPSTAPDVLPFDDEQYANRDRAYTEARWSLKHQLPHPGLGIMGFNDDVDTVHANVLAALDAAIADLGGRVAKEGARS